MPKKQPNLSRADYAGVHLRLKSNLWELDIPLSLCKRALTGQVLSEHVRRRHFFVQVLWGRQAAVGDVSSYMMVQWFGVSDTLGQLPESISSPPLQGIETHIPQQSHNTQAHGHARAACLLSHLLKLWQCTSSWDVKGRMTVVIRALSREKGDLSSKSLGIGAGTQLSPLKRMQSNTSP